MKTTWFLLAVTLLVRCGPMSDAAPTSTPAAPGDLRWIDTIRELDERSDALLGAAKFQTVRKELIDFADQASHAHTRRSDEIKQWRTFSFSTAPQDVVLPACAQREFRVGSKASELEILDALVAHRECALSYASEALANVHSTNARRVLEATARTFTAELQQLRAWRTAWK